MSSCIHASEFIDKLKYAYFVRYCKLGWPAKDWNAATTALHHELLQWTLDVARWIALRK
jgi:hypothetical protein